MACNWFKPTIMYRQVSKTLKAGNTGFGCFNEYDLHCPVALIVFQKSRWRYQLKISRQNIKLLRRNDTDSLEIF
jgi:hypothetical protein